MSINSSSHEVIPPAAFVPMSPPGAPSVILRSPRATKDLLLVSSKNEAGTQSRPFARPAESE